MKSIGSIFEGWRKKRDTSKQWSLAHNPRGKLENAIFGSDPSVLLKSNTESRDALYNLNYLQDIQEKGTYAKFTYALAKFWIFLLFFVVIAQGVGGRGNAVLEVLGYRMWWLNFHLSENEFIAFITSTTATVLGLAYLVGRYLFVQKSNGEKLETAKNAASPFVSPASKNPLASPVADPLPPPSEENSGSKSEDTAKTEPTISADAGDPPPEDTTK